MHIFYLFMLNKLFVSQDCSKDCICGHNLFESTRSGLKYPNLVSETFQLYKRSSEKNNSRPVTICGVVTHTVYC